MYLLTEFQNTGRTNRTIKRKQRKLHTIPNSHPQSLQTANAREGVDKREPSYSVGGNVNWYSQYGKQYDSSLKTKNITTI